MKRPINRNLARLLIYDYVRRNLYSSLLVFLLLAILGVAFTNVPISTQPIEGRFVRWTLKTSKGLTSPWVFVDLADGRTTAVKAWPGWQPPAAGSVIRLQESTLLWFGKSYSLMP